MICIKVLIILRNMNSSKSNCYNNFSLWICCQPCRFQGSTRGLCGIGNRLRRLFRLRASPSECRGSPGL
ncbi:unnamed protein product [Moneuplotes crassus]|uniref:Uncharacterized protein n=1 Tax=Euplotes crassus TaxID=5936 RepID=A0AAD2CZL8_EUPCR|nr:unnamed protein product [Moneuplotes crassus]